MGNRTRSQIEACDALGELFIMGFNGLEIASETANFISVPMATQAIEQIMEWNPKEIQKYCYKISKDALKDLQGLGFTIEDDDYRSHHLIGIRIPGFVNIKKLKQQFEKNSIYVSIRGNYIRVSPHLYNTKDDFTQLVNCIKSTIK